MHKYDWIGQQGKQIHHDKEQLQLQCFMSSNAYFPFLFFLFDPFEGLVLLKGDPFSFTSNCTEELSLERALEEPRFILSLVPELDFFGLRLLTPLRPICFSSFLKLLNYRLDLFVRLFRTFGTFALACRSSESRINSGLGGLASNSAMCLLISSLARSWV